MDYGRVSSGDVPTMTVAQDYPVGRARLLPLRSPVWNFQDLLAEAEAMAEAEGLPLDPETRCQTLSRSWCYVAVGFLPTSRKPQYREREERVQNIAREAWSYWNERLNGRAYYDKFWGPWTRPTDSDGIFLDLWFNYDRDVERRYWEELAEIDFVLCTLTKPREKNIPTDELVKLIAADAGRQYFLNNVAAGLTTSRDEEILAELGRLTAFRFEAPFELREGTGIWSPNRRQKLWFQQGQLILREAAGMQEDGTGKKLWSSPGHLRGLAARFQQDGNLVIYRELNTESPDYKVWASDTDWKTDRVAFVLPNQGLFSIESPGRKAWNP